MPQVVSETQHDKALQGICPGVFDVSFRDVPGNAPVLPQHIVNGEGNLSTFVFEHLLTDSYVPQPIILVEILGKAGVKLMRQIRAQHEAFHDDPVEAQAGVLAEIFRIAPCLQGVDDTVPTGPGRQGEVNLVADVAGEGKAHAHIVVIGKVPLLVQQTRGSGIVVGDIEIQIRLDQF